MAKSREIKRRIKAVGNIERITKTMQMIATARFQASHKRASEAKPYTRKIAQLVGELAAIAAGSGAQVSHPLLTSPVPATNRELVLVISSSRGLCGGYNGGLLRLATRYLKDNPDKQIDLEVIGKKGVAFFKFTGQPMSKVHGEFGDQPKYEDVERVANDYIDAFTAGKYDAVKVIYVAFETMTRQAPHVLQLLPMEDPSVAAGSEGANGRAGATADYDFSPEPIELLAELLPQTVKTSLFQCFNEAVVSEQISRMVAMKAATDNASQMVKDLGRLFNRARQTAITTELSEIIGGAAALE